MEIPDPTPVILLVPTGDAENPSFLLLLLKISLLTFCLLMSVAGCRLKSPVWLESHRLQPFYTLPGLCAAAVTCVCVGAQDAGHSWREVGSGGWTASASGFPWVREQKKRERKGTGLITHSPLSSTVCYLD